VAAAGETEQGRALFAELLWVHSMVRRDLDTVQRLAAEVVEDLAPEELRAELEALQTNGPLWRLKVDCLRYCRFVHMHHGAEDVMLFPSLRRADPGIGEVVDRLEHEHRQVSDLLDAVEAAARELTDLDTATARRRVADALDGLAELLLAHLDYEELSIGPALRRLEHL
jgi:iron-sulfur cluster repair protein YtfE (RIC family)